MGARTTVDNFAGVDWATATWDDFHPRYPEIAKSTFYNKKSQYKPAVIPIPIIDPPPAVIDTSTLTDVQHRIIGRMMRGEGESQSVEQEGISVAEHLMWMNNTEKFGPAYPEIVKKALLCSRQRIKDTLFENIKSWGTKQWTSSAWLLERMFPAEFAKPGEGTGRTTVNVGIQLNVSRKCKAKDISSKVKVS
jgi:hypothetical protein